MIGAVAALKGMIAAVVFGVMAFVEWWTGLGATVPENVNVVLNFFALLILVVGMWLAPRYLRAKSAEAMIAERDKTIAGYEQLSKLHEEEADAYRSKAAELGGMLDETRTDAAGWHARYEEQSKYTAQPALEAIQQLLEHNNVEAERRHSELLLALRAFASKRVQVDGG